MNNEIIYIITNNISRDVAEFKNQFNEFVSHCSVNTIKMIDGNIFRFHTINNLQGIRNYKYYNEFYNSYLKLQNKLLQQENAQLKEQINKAIEHCNNEIKASKEETTELINTIEKRDCTPTEKEQRRFDILNRYAWEIKEVLNILESNKED